MARKEAAEAAALALQRAEAYVAAETRIKAEKRRRRKLRRRWQLVIRMVLSRLRTHRANQACAPLFLPETSSSSERGRCVLRTRNTHQRVPVRECDAIL